MKKFIEIGNRVYKLELIQKFEKTEQDYGCFRKKTNSKWWQIWLREWSPRLKYSLVIEYGTNKAWIEGHHRRDIEKIRITFSYKEERDKEYDKLLLELNNLN